jgi:diguanylate cyclase (GGDEF)-like protein
MIDLDNFKLVNDRYGHQVGDEVLILAARTIAGELRASDIAARFGGDEFVALLPQTDGQHARSLGTRIAERFAEEARLQFPDIEIGLSIGIADLGRPMTNPEELVRAADRALYAAKQRGKNCIESAPTSVL